MDRWAKREEGGRAPLAQPERAGSIAHCDNAKKAWVG